jgi:hypothetical protein
VKTFVIWVTIMFIVDSFIQVVHAKKKIPITFAMINGIFELVLACWGMTLLGWL